MNAIPTGAAGKCEGLAVYQPVLHVNEGKKQMFNTP